MDKVSSGIYSKLYTAFQDIRAAIEKLNGSVDVKPHEFGAVLRPGNLADDTVVEFEIRPLVFKLPERGGASSNNLFVVVRGRMAFDRAAFKDSDLLLTSSFATEVAYFRNSSEGLQHIYGAHYDVELDRAGHPVFHAQMQTYNEYWTYIRDEYGITVESQDLVTKILRNVRVPIAQLDVFSVFVQLCADHLIYEKSPPEEVSAFNTLVKENGFCRGAAYKSTQLSSEDARRCYRARHWYPVTAN